jgi:hypothetical protein
VKQAAAWFGRDAGGASQAEPKFIKAGPSQPKLRPNFCKKKSLDFLGFPCRKQAFSMGYRDPLGKKIFCWPARRYGRGGRVIWPRRRAESRRHQLRIWRAVKLGIHGDADDNAVFVFSKAIVEKSEFLECSQL